MRHRSRQREDPSQRGGVVSSLIALVAAIFLLAVLYLARHPIFRLVGEGWVVEDTLDRSDAIFVLSDERVAHDADNTREEAITLAQVAKQKKWRSIIVVTSNFHTRRARYIFSHVFPKDTKVRVTGARDGDFDPERWWEKRISVKDLSREIAGMIVAIWEQHTGPAMTDKSQLIVAPAVGSTLLVV